MSKLFKIISKIPEDSFYLAHPLRDRRWIREWELKIESKSGKILINPFYDIERKDIALIDQGLITRFDVDPKIVVERDLKIVKRCKNTIGFITGNISYGTIMEIVYANLFNKNVYSLVLNGQEKHVWLRYHSKEIFTKVEDLENFLVKTKKN